MLTRALTAALLLGGFLAALFLLDARAFAALAGLVVAGGAREWARLSALGPGPAWAYASACLAGYALLAFLLFPLSSVWPVEQAVFGIAAVFWLLIAPLLLRRGLEGLARPLLLAIGAVVLLPAGLAMATLAPGTLLATLALVWISDTAAYLGGRAFGRHKLAPAISPGKTWEGVWAGLGAVLIYAIICTYLPGEAANLAAHGWLPYLAGAGALCLAGVLGDLLESSLKRRAGAKDSGTLLPGHGGILDRIDSATAVLPAAAFLLHWAP